MHFTSGGSTGRPGAVPLPSGRMPARVRDRGVRQQAAIEEFLRHTRDHRAPGLEPLPTRQLHAGHSPVAGNHDDLGTEPELAADETTPGGSVTMCEPEGGLIFALYGRTGL